ncbi:hypothetical protein OIU83_19015 [Flavobacterium sp. LS1R49]|uniref:Uncharacterized protein n=1 Tax=Flavobacterium shii TaxID=2987687 RepID=A0A9X2ZI39_9FLAO|nr:hypothetical protein [Flavobacterium shii]MCV9929760.1 hypothetical protein [Flavobacterium shii]
MKLNKFAIIILASIAILASSCGSDNKKMKDAHNDSDPHNHTEGLVNKDTTKKVNKYENALGQALDKKGKFITGCPSHKEMIGSKGDKCPKCGYMTMLPITWSLEGVDTLRVTSFSDYNPPIVK